MTYQEALKYTLEALHPMDLTMPGLEARELVAFASDVAGITVRPDDVSRLRMVEAPEGIREELDKLLDRRLRGEPLAYILGEWDFYGLTLEVNNAVLIPRSDTETVVETALDMIKDIPSPRILDLCCGSGAIGIALLKQRTDARCVFGDISKDALIVCRHNVKRHELENRAQVIDIDATEPADSRLGKFDIIVSNPPYISSDEMNILPIDVVGFEPREALYGGFDGLSFYRAITNGFKRVMKPGGMILFECGAYQADEVVDIMTNSGFIKVEKHLDLNKIERSVSAYIE